TVADLPTQHERRLVARRRLRGLPRREQCVPERRKGVSFEQSLPALPVPDHRLLKDTARLLRALQAEERRAHTVQRQSLARRVADAAEEVERVFVVRERGGE